MDQHTLKQSRLTPCTGVSALFFGDVLDMNGGKCVNEDLRPFLLKYLEGADEEVVIVNKPKDIKYGNYQIILRLGSGGSLEVYNPTDMMSSGHELTRQQGNLTVPSSGKGHRIWDGKFVVEYDLIDADSKGRKYLFMDGIGIANVRETRKENEEMGDCANAIDTDDEEFTDMVATKAARLNGNKGPVVSGSSLLTEIKILAELYREETESLEKVCCLDPVMRNLLIPALPEGTPMFKVAFLTNVMCMGFKAVFYPTILEHIDTTSTTSTAVIDAVFALQTRLLEDALPKICCSVEDIIKKKRCIKFFRLDAGGTGNLSLPANVKVDKFAVPYHQFKVHHEGVVSISNKELVTTLGVKKRGQVFEWLEKLAEFETKSKFSKAFSRREMGSDWRRNLLFSDMSAGIPFRKRAALMDLDYYVSGLCFGLLNSEYGLCVDMNGAGESNRLSSQTRATKTIVLESGNTTTTFEGVLASNDSAAAAAAAASAPSTPTEKLFKKYDELRRSAGECPLLSQGVTLDLTKRVYNGMVSSNKFFLLLMALYNDEDKELGIVTNDGVEGFATAIKNVITAKTKTAKKSVADNMFVDKLNLVRSTIDMKTVVGAGDGKYSLVLAYGVFQMVLRHLIRDMGIDYSNIQDIASRVTSLRWENLDLQDLWEKLHAEETIKPTTETDRLFAKRLAESAASVTATSAQNDKDIRGDRLGQLISDINANRESEEVIALRNKTVEKLGSEHDHSPFATSANGNDTMFLWTVVTFAERFCHLYNAVNNPSAYYLDMVNGYGLSFAGGLENFEALCRLIKSELDVFMSAAGAKPPVFTCRDCAKRLEKKIEKEKNRVNKDLLAIKKKELEMTMPSSCTVPVTWSEMSSQERYVYMVHTDDLYRSIFECLNQEEDDKSTASDLEGDDCAYESGGEDEDFGEVEEEGESVLKRLDEVVVRNGINETLKDDVISDFFKRYSKVRSFKNRSALCHRQENVMIKSLLIMDKFLSGYVVTPKIIKHQNDHASILKEVHERSNKGRAWTIPYTFPVKDVEECSCHNSIRLLTVPENNSTRQLTSAMRFSTMACERKFFTDVSHSLGFVKTADAAVDTTKETEYLFEEPSLDIYRGVILPEKRLRECILPRTMARFHKDTYDSSLVDLENYASFFTGLWSLCAKANLETTVLSAVVSSPQEASSLLTDTSSADRREANRLAVRTAIDVIGSRKDLSVCASLLELTKCVEMTEMGGEIDTGFFFDLSRRNSNVRNSNGAHMWNLLDNIKRCFDNSLPVDWRKHLSGCDTLLNLVPNAPNTDESGMVFETCRFLSRCTELMMGSGYGRLSKCLSGDEWRSLLLRATNCNPSWIARMALVYEKVMNTDDSRTTEVFVNSSSFLTNNNVNKKLSINETKSDKIRLACWEGTEILSLDERIDLLMAVERTNSKMTFSTVLLSCALYRILIDGERVEDLIKTPNTDKFVPIIKCLSIVNASWGPEHNMNGQLDYIEKCAERGRFENIEEDPLFFYRFVAYVLGMRANNDQFFEELMGTVTESFDFNGVDTRNWTDFIEKHFVSFLLGRRAFLVSRPSAFIKRVIGRGSGTDDDISESLRRLAKLILVKSVDSDELTVSDLLMCCIGETDITASTTEEYHTKFYRFGNKIAKSTSSSIANMASSACSTEQLSKKLKSSRPNDIRVQFNKKPDINSIERDEEAEADLSYGLYSDTVERAVIRSDRDESRINGEGRAAHVALPQYRKRASKARKGDKGGPNGRTEDFFDHGSRDDTVGTMTGYANSIGSNSSDAHPFVKENDLLLRKTTDFSNEEIIIAADNISKLAIKLKRQDKIKESICQMIDNITHNLTVTCPISEHDDPQEFCLTKKAATRLMTTVGEWNSIVKAEAERFKEECKEIEKTSSYDMKMVLCGDYDASNMGGPSDEIHVFKTPLARRKKPQSDEEDDDYSAEKWSKKSGGGRQDGAGFDGRRQQQQRYQQPLEDEQLAVAVAMTAPHQQETSPSVDAFVRNAQEEYTERLSGFGDGTVMFKQRLCSDKLLDTSILASVFSSKFIDPYKRDVVPGLMQHIINGQTNNSNKKRKGLNKEDQRNHYAFSSLNIIRVNGELSRTDQCSNRHNAKLVSLYDNVSEEQQINGVSDIITKEDVRVSLRMTDASGEDDYATVKNVWLCNSGIHPRDQVEMFKKMSFRNYNKIWLKMYEEAINLFRRWGVIKKSTIDKPYFCVKYTNMPANVTDTNPPNAVLHSKFLSKPDLDDRIAATGPLIKLRDLYDQSMRLSDSERLMYMSTPFDNLDSAILNKAILCREFMTSTYDESGSFIASKFTNSAVFMFTPGTSTESVEGLDEDYDFVGREKILNTNSFASYHSTVIEALRHGVFDTSYNDAGRMLRMYDNDMITPNGSAVNVVGLPDSSSARHSEYVTKKAVRDTVKDNNHATTVKYSVFGHLTSSFSVLNANYNARNILMRIRKLDREAAGITGGENNEWTANDMSLKYIFGRMRGYVFFGDEFPQRASCSRLAVTSRCFDCLYESPKHAIFFKDWYTISMIPDLTRTSRLCDKIRACLKVNKKLDIGIKMILTPPSQSQRQQLPSYLSTVDKKTAYATRGVSFLANPVITLKWFLTRGHHLRLSSTNNGVASLSNFMGNRENKRTLEDLPPSSRGLATSFKMKTSRNSCISVDSNRFFLVNGTYLLGGRLEGVNLTTDMFVRCKLHTEKIIVQGALFDTNTSIAFLASCIEGAPETRGLPMIEHISRLANVTSNDAHMKNYWSVDKADMLTEEDNEEIVANVSTDSASTNANLFKAPSVYIDDENYIFLAILHSIVEDFAKKPNKNVVEDHLSRALKKTYTEVVDQRTGTPNMHSLFYLKSLMNFCGYISGVCTGDGEKMHHLLHTLSAIGLNMTPKMAMCIVGELGNNLKSSVINIVKAAWWDKHADMGVEAFVGKGDASSTDAKLAYVAGKMMIYIMEEVGYQGSAAVPSTPGPSSFPKKDNNNSNNNEEKLDTIYNRNIEIACGLWDRTVARIKTNGASAALTSKNIKKRARDTDDEDEYSTTAIAPTTRVINYISDRVGWWSHVKGHVLIKINRDKILSSFVTGPDVPFCTSTGSILDDSPWVRRTDIVLSHSNNDTLDNETSSSLPSEIRKNTIDEIKRKPGTNKFRTFKESLEMMKTRLDLNANMWSLDERSGLLVEATNNATAVAGASSSSAVYALHAFNPSSISYRGLSSRNFRKRLVDSSLIDTEDIGSILSRPREICKEIVLSSDDSTTSLIKPTVEQTIAHVLNNPGRYGFPCVSIDGIEIFHINKNTPERVLTKVAKGGVLNASALEKEIIALLNAGEDAAVDTGVKDTAGIDPLRTIETFTALFSNFDDGDIPIAASSVTPSWCKNTTPLNLKERSLLASIQSVKPNSVFSDSNKASSKMNKDSPMTKDMLPGQVSSNKLKQIASTDSTMSVRGLHGRPFTCSASATPVMISNSYLLKFFVDVAMYKRMLIFPFETNFAARNIEPNVDLGDRIITSGLKVVHAFLLSKRTDLWNSATSTNRQRVRLVRRLKEWNMLMGSNYTLNDSKKFMATFPSVFLEHVKNTKVLELSDNSNMIKLEEAANTFFQAHSSTVMLSARPNTLIKEASSSSKAAIEYSASEGDGGGGDSAHKQMCIINPKNMDTLLRSVERSKTRGVWGLVNSALRPVLFVDLPFQDTDVIYGEGNTLKLKAGFTTFNVSFGVRMPDIDGGKGDSGLIGIGESLMKHLVGSWGSTNVKNVMYSCHQLHMMYELAIQETNVCKKLHNVGDMTSDSMSNVAFMLLYSIYIDMFEKFGAFVSGEEEEEEGFNKKQKRCYGEAEAAETEEEEAVEKSSGYPVFPGMVINKTMKHINNLSNLADMKDKTRCHSAKIFNIMSGFEKKLNPRYLCDECIKYYAR